MMCPACQHEDSKVVDSRDAGDCTRRRRECLACAARFTTFERVEFRLPTLVKRDGRRQVFSREKLLSGLQLACRKRPVTDEQLDSLITRVERELATRADRELPTADLGAMALRELQVLDHVAYLRFASVYHAVGSPEDFLEVLRPLLERR
ncbi:MAG: transcriptional regulator NrdR [Pseudomonadota bacterium]|nr:transcriptional regulator NrdR [Pseudomonadota bacterium]